MEALQQSQSQRQLNRQERLGDPSHLPALDGARGLAVLLVLLYHLSNLAPHFALLRLFHPGWMGVDLFFVLSGFLITRILDGRRDSTDYYRRFYIRRGLRIWPLYYAVLLAAFAVGAVARHFGLATLPEDAAGMMAPPALRTVTPAWMYLLFVQNFCAASAFAAVDLLSVTWSLCIEEHFYLTWPFAVRKLGDAGLRRLLWGVLLVSPVVRLVALMVTHTTGFARYEFIYRPSPFHFDSIAAGCLLFLYWKQPAGLARRLAWLCVAVGAAGAVICMHGPARFPRAEPVMTALLFSMVAMLCAGLVSLVLLGTGKMAFTWRPLRYMGRISYGVYLIHLPVIAVTEALLLKHGLVTLQSPVRGRLLSVGIGFPLAIAIAALSFRFFETPFLRQKRNIAP